MTKRATMNDIALQAGVSQATVSLVLNEVPNARVSKETRDRVQAIAESMGYARRGGVSPAADVRLIGLMIDDVTATPFATPLIEGARDQAAAAGCLVATFVTGGNPATEEVALQVLQASRLVGVLYASLVTRLVAPPARLLQVPTVLLNCHDKSHAFPTVTPGDVTGAIAATEVLIRAGHRRIAHLQGEDWGEAARDRTLGYRRALTSHDIPFDPALLEGPAWTVASGREATLRLLDLPDPPTAIFCFNDRVAIGCYEALHMRGLRVPQDMSVMGFDNDDLVANVQPPLSTMVLPHDEMARWAVGQLLERQEGVRLQPLRVKVDCEPVLRGSVGPPRQAPRRGD
jgi:LacI family transcriptional regulator